MEDTIFTKIIKRELPAEIIYEDDTTIVILDRCPNIEGQMLVITKKQVPYLFDLDEETYRHVMAISKKMARALDQTFETRRTCAVVEGFDVPHVHVRLYPTHQGQFSLKPGPMATDDELRAVGEKIRAHIS
ncbi:HIT family protein [Candidatus Parcubacteria bacterium]|nr:HIT family protein [Candidatus Parcubacteria bacterium]